MPERRRGKSPRRLTGKRLDRYVEWLVGVDDRHADDYEPPPEPKGSLGTDGFSILYSNGLDEEFVRPRGYWKKNPSWRRHRAPRIPAGRWRGWMGVFEFCAKCGDGRWFLSLKEKLWCSKCGASRDWLDYYERMQEMPDARHAPESDVREGHL